MALRAAGLSVWLDEVEMGHDLAVSMSEGIGKSSVVVVLASPDYAASVNCELHYCIVTTALSLALPLLTRVHRYLT